MNKLRKLLKKSGTPITIMFIPHSRASSRRIKMPVALLASILLFAGIGLSYTTFLSYRLVDYYQTKRKLDNLSRQFNEVRGSIAALKESESQFKRLFAFDSKKEVLESMAPDNEGSIDAEELKKQVDASLAAVSEIRQYLSRQRDVYRVTPQGWPVAGRISSPFGMREHPRYHIEKFHTGVDLSVPTGTDVHVTADGIVSYSGWTPGNGNVVVVEHGEGFSTVYAHNSRNLAKVGQVVRRGDVIAAAGATGVATGSHVHYEVWKAGQCVNPVAYAKS